MIRFSINGDPREVDVAPNTKAIFVLRNDLAQTDVRLGCGEGFCGACVVLVDGQPITTCDMAVEALEGKQIRTAQGFGDSDNPHPVQAALIKHQAGQCGYCLSGIIASSVALYEHAEVPTESEIRAALDRHLCRCGTQYRILNAVREAVSGCTAR